MADTPNIMSIRELIDAAFGKAEINQVNHKLIQTILVLLARQLRLLERRVAIELGSLYDISSATTLSVSEVKMHTKVIKKGTKPGSVKGHGQGAAKAKAPDKGVRPAGPDKKLAEKALIDKSSADDTTLSSTEKSTSEKTKSTSDKTSSDQTYSNKTSTGQSFSVKATTDAPYSDKTTADQSSASKTTIDQLSPDKTMIEKESIDLQSNITTKADKSTTEATFKKTPSGKSPSTTSKTSISSVSGKSTDKKAVAKTDRKASNVTEYLQRLRVFEEERERVLRVIHQRADSREEQDKTPLPMASLDSIEKQYEKLLVVERVPTSEARRAESRTTAPRLSVVTQDEFEELAAAVRRIQEFLSPAAIPGFPDNAQLLSDLRKGASLTDAMAALQLSARIEAAEKTLQKMLSLVTDLATNMPAADLQATSGKVTEAAIKTSDEKETAVILEAELGVKSKESITESIYTKLPSRTEIDAKKTDTTALTKKDEENKDTGDWVTHDELDKAMQDIYDEFNQVISSNTTRSNVTASNALKIANRLEEKLTESLSLGGRMADVEKIVSQYADQVNFLDTGLSSQMTNYQEQLTQMQHDLEAGVEAMQEGLANTGGDTAAVGELNNNFTNLQMDFDIAANKQKELHDIQDALAMDLQGLWKQIEILRDTKSDRDEVADALRDKAGLAALNGLVSRQEFDAVRGDFEKRIGSAYDKFNSQEIMWQKAIDDLLRELNEKADFIQLVTLQESIKKYLDKFRNEINFMKDIVGEPRAAAISRKLHRDADCLSCATPAHMDVESKTGHLLPKFPSSKSPASPAEAEAKPSEDGDHRGLCYPGHSISHAIDPRSHFCRRYCGGSHTMLNNTVNRVPPSMIISPAMREISTEIGSDGKAYVVDVAAKKPCLPCNVPAKEPALSEEFVSGPKTSFAVEDGGSDMTPSDYQLASQQFIGSFMMRKGSEVSDTPPPHMED